MIIEEYKETILHKLEKAGNRNDVELIIDRSIEQFPENDLFKYLVTIYLHILQKELQNVSEENVDSLKKRNIGHALTYLRQMNQSREKPA